VASLESITLGQVVMDSGFAQERAPE